jgi:hypothetical protein
MLFKDKNKQCVICWKEINFNKDKYVKLSDYTGKKETDHCFYHLDCWINKNRIVEGNIKRIGEQYLNNISEQMGGNKVIQIQ